MTALRPYQDRAIAALRASYTSGHRAPCLVLPTGGGKCLGLGTPVLRFDGTIVPVEAVQVGDLLMGPDSMPRRVISTTRGRSSLYRITPARGTAWVCNDVHVLTLVNTTSGNVVDIDLPTYLHETKTYRHEHKQFAPDDGIDFATAEALPLDPYFVGVWYGDGSKSLVGVAISKPDPEILDVCREIAARFGLHVRTDGDPCPTHHIVGPRGSAPNPLLDLVRSIAGRGTELPHRYLTASRTNRLSFLAGLLDTDGHMHRSGFEIVQKQRGFADGICFLARSLGMRALMAEKIVNGVSYWRVSISGNCSVIPTRIPRKQAPERKQIKCATRTGFSVDAIGEGEYAGFEIDGDGRFLLGDFTVTHNTVVAAEIIRSAVVRGRRVLFLAHRAELLTQSVNKLSSAGIDDVRVIQAARDLGSRTAAVAVASVPTLTKWGDRMPEADLVIFDECHHTIAATWQRIADAYAGALLLGMTATPQRGDGKPLGDIFDALVVGATVRELTDLEHLVPCRVWAPPAALGTAEIALAPVDAYQRHAIGERAIVFCSTVEHAQLTADDFNAAGIATAVVHGAAARGDTLKRFRAGEIRVICNVHVLTEGFDDPGVSVCILARRMQHAGTMLQCAGRVLRPAPGKRRAQLIDLCGSVHEHGTPDADREYMLDGQGIKQTDRQPIRQCPHCGSVFVFTGGTECPECAVTLPVAIRSLARVTGIGLEELPPLPPRPMRSIEIDAKFASRCARCASAIHAGDRVLWRKGEKAVHAVCPQMEAVAS